MTDFDCQVAVIGGGPGGLAAAAAAYDAGAEDVVVLERDVELGGILQQCIHNGFGVSIFDEDLTGPEYAERFIRQVDDRGIRCERESMVLDISNERVLTVASKAGGMIRVRPRAVVLAMGCRERTRGAIGLPGARPAGILTAGTAQRLINIYGIFPGKKFLILGSGDIGMIMARRLRLEGCEVVGVVELEEQVGGLSRNLVQCLQDFDIPLLLRHTVTDIRGTNRVEAVEVSPLDDSGVPDTSRAMVFECDTLLTSVGLIPENELSKRIGVVLDRRTSGPLVDEAYQTSADGVFAAGNVLQVYDLVDDVTRCGIQAGKAAADFALGRRTKAGGYTEVNVGNGVRTVVPQRIEAFGTDTDGSGSVAFHLRSRRVMRKATLEVRDSQSRVRFSKRYSILRPSQMFTAVVPRSDLADAGKLDVQLEG